jgi:hypothetical protein
MAGSHPPFLGVAEPKNGRFSRGDQAPLRSSGSVASGTTQLPSLTERHVRQYEDDVFEVAQGRSRSCSGATRGPSPLSHLQAPMQKASASDKTQTEPTDRVLTLPPLPHSQASTPQSISSVPHVQCTSISGSTSQGVPVCSKDLKASQVSSDSAPGEHLNGSKRASNSSKHGSTGMLPLKPAREFAATSPGCAGSPHHLELVSTCNETAVKSECTSTNRGSSNSANVGVESSRRTLSPLCAVTAAGDATPQAKEHTQPLHAVPAADTTTLQPQAVLRPGSSRGKSQGGIPVKRAPLSAEPTPRDASSCDGAASDASGCGSAMPAVGVTTSQPQGQTRAASRPGGSRSKSQGGSTVKLAPLSSAAATTQRDASSCDGAASDASGCGSAVSMSTDRGVLKLVPLSGLALTSSDKGARLALGSEVNQGEEVPAPLDQAGLFAVRGQSVSRPGSAESRAHGERVAKLTPLPTVSTESLQNVTISGREPKDLSRPSSARNASPNRRGVKLAPVANTASTSRCVDAPSAVDSRVLPRPGSSRSNMHGGATVKLTPL